MFLFFCRFLYFWHFNTDYTEAMDKLDANLPLNEWDKSVLAENKRHFKRCKNDVNYHEKYSDALDKCIIDWMLTSSEKREFGCNLKLDRNILDKYKQIRKRVKEQKAISKDEQALYTKFSQFYSEVHNMMLERGFVK